MTARQRAAALFSALLVGGSPGLCPAAGGFEPFALIPTGHRAVVTTNALKQDLFDEYQVRVWSSTDGLPQNHVDTVVRDQQGYLWISTWLGLCRFNGHEFVTFTPVNTPVLRSETISDLLRGRDGEIWVGTRQGLYRMRGTQFEHFGEAHGLPGGHILSLTEGPNGHKWLATTEGLARYDGTNAVIYLPETKHRRIQNIHFLPDGRALAFSAGETLATTYSFDPANGEFGPLPERFQQDGRPVMRREIAGPDRDGTTWFRTENALYHLRPDGRVVKFRDLRETIRREQVLLLCDSRGDVWFTGAEPGVLERHSRGHTTTMNLAASHQITSFVSLTEEPDGTYWLCTRQGLVQLRERAVRNFGRRHGLLHDYVYSLADLGRGRALLGTWHWPAVLDLENEVIRLFSLPGVNLTSRALLPNPDGSFWVTDGDCGPTHVAADGRISHTTLTRQWPYRAEQSVFFRDSMKRLWIGATTNLHVVEGDRVRRLVRGDIPGLPADDVRVIREMPDKTIWLGGNDSGVTVLAPEAMTVMHHYTTASGLSHDDVWALEPGEPGEVWVGTAHGLNRIRQGRCHRILPEHGLAEGVINQILRDQYGYLWLTGMKGTYRVDPAEISACLDGRVREFSVLPITADDGMLNAETNGEQQPAGFVDDTGRLWIPTIAGVTIISPSRFRPDARPGRPIIEKILLDRTILFDNGPGPHGKISLADPFSFAAGRGRLLEIHFAAPAAEMSGAATYEVRLHGYDDDWRKINRQSSIIYPSLPPGEFSFDVRVSDHHRQTSDHAPEFRFQIAAHPYQTGWFRTLVIAAALVLAYALHRRRLAIVSHVRGLEQREALLSERERIAQDMHDDLGSRLTHISLLADVAQRQAARPDKAQLQELNLAAREAARAVEEIVWSANPGNDSLSSLVSYLTQHAANMLGAAGISCRVKADFDWPDTYLPPQARHAVFMAFKEAIHNIVKHAAATEARLTIAPEPMGIYLALADNGHGFDPAGDRRDEQDGLTNMAARLVAVGGRFAIESTPGGGTKVEFWLPLWAPETEDRSITG